MNLVLKKMGVVFCLILGFPVLLLAQETSGRGGEGMRGMENMMGNWGGRGSEESRLRGPFSSSYSSYSTTNNTTSSGTSDCLWGGSNCRKTFGKNAEQAIYIARMMEQLTEESAQGQGEHLIALAQLMGCSSQNIDLFSQEVQKNRSLIFSSSAPSVSKEEVAHVLRQLRQVVVQHDMLKETCSV